MTFRPASRTEAKPLIGLHGLSGAGKTWSALLLARGYVGPNGKIGMIETEAGRGEANAGREPVGDYIVDPIRNSFSSKRYGQAIAEAEKEKLDALIIDSASHEWDNDGGVIAAALENSKKGLKGMLAWQEPKIEHQRYFMLRLMQTPIPLVIVTMRSKYPMEQVELDGKKTWVRSTELEPIQAEGILNEMFVHGWIDQAHIFHGVKYTVPGVEKAIIDGQPINIATGQRLAAWAKGSPVSSSLSSTAEKAAPSVDASPEVIDGGAAELSDNDQLADDTLEEAARDGMVSLGLAWKLLNKKERATLKSRLDTVHKPVAEMMDAKEGVE